MSSTDSQTDCLRIARGKGEPRNWFVFKTNLQTSFQISPLESFFCLRIWPRAACGCHIWRLPVSDLLIFTFVTITLEVPCGVALGECVWRCLCGSRRPWDSGRSIMAVMGPFVCYTSHSVTCPCITQRGCVCQCSLLGTRFFLQY